MKKFLISVLCVLTLLTLLSIPAFSVAPLKVCAGRDYLRSNYLNIVGEVINNTEQWYEYVKVVATFYDANKNMLGTGYTYIQLDKLAPLDTGAFKLSSKVGGLATTVASYKLQVQGRPTNELPSGDLIVMVKNEYESHGYYHLVGLVKNEGKLDCEFVKIIAAFYDANNKVVDVQYTYTELDRISAGETSPFQLSVKALPKFDHFQVWVQGKQIKD